MDVSIIIVNYNTRLLIKQCLKSIYLQTQNILFEIIVVDNASIDGSQQMIEDEFPNVILIKSKINWGFGKANNLGIEQAKGNYIFLLNSDTILFSNAVKILADYISSNVNVGICGGNLYTEDYKPAMSFLQIMPGLLLDVDLFFGSVISKILYKKNAIFNYSNRPMIINGFILGADMMIRRQILNETNAFDPDFFMYYEEVELTWRIKRLGYKVASVPSAKIVHLEKGSENVKQNTARRAFQSLYIYYIKTGKKRQIRFLHYLFILTAYQRMFIFKMLGKKDRMKNWVDLLAWEKQYNYFNTYGTDMETRNAAQN